MGLKCINHVFLSDPYAYVVSANLHRRHLDAEAKREVIAALVKAQPEKSNRQIAAMTDTSHPTVGKIRSEAEARGEVPRVTTHTDTKGRHQPAKKEPSLLSRSKTGDVESAYHAEPAPAPEIAERQRKAMIAARNQTAAVMSGAGDALSDDSRSRLRHTASELQDISKVSEACDRHARILHSQGATIAIMPLSDRVSLAREILDALGVAPDDLQPQKPTAAPSTPAAQFKVIVDLIDKARRCMDGAMLLNMIPKQDVIDTELPFTAKQVKDLGAGLTDLAKTLGKIERARKARPTESEAPETTSRRDALRRCLDGGQTQAHVARATGIAASQLNAFLAARVRLGPASAARLSAYLAEHADIARPSGSRNENPKEQSAEPTAAITGSEGTELF
jgi:hypothetical protein